MCAPRALVNPRYDGAAVLPFILAFGAVIALFTLGVRWGAVVIGKVLGRVIDERHHHAEYITTTGQVPEAWTGPYFKRIATLQASGELQPAARERRIARLEWQAKRRSLKGIDDLLRYFARAPVFADDHSRRVLMEQLQAARETWREHMRNRG